MAAPYVTAALILSHVKEASPTADETAWATAVAAALEAEIAYKLDGLTPSADQEAAIIRAAILDGAAGYNDRDAPHGILSVGPDGDAVRLGRDLCRALVPVLRRVGTVGIG